MRTQRNIRILLVVALLGAVAWGLLNLFALRFAAGDVYPVYASQRTDPLGLAVLHEGLRALPGVTVTRNFKPWDRLTADADTAVIVAGVSPWSMEGVGEGGAGPEDGDVGSACRRLAAQGGRVIVASYDDGRSGRRRLAAADSATDTNAPAGREEEHDHAHAERTDRDASCSDGRCAPRQPVDVCTTCGRKHVLPKREFQVTRDTNRFDNVETVARLTAAFRDAGLPAELPWRGELYFDGLSNGWETVYARGDDAVMIARPLGRGSLVCMADAYLLSNEAMLKDRQPGLLAWLLDDRPQVVFDEFHLGLVSRASAGVLMRRYRLQGLLLGLIALAGLYVWRAALPLVPFADGAGADAAAADRVQGRDSQSGLVTLLRRSIPPRDIVARCAELWRQAGVRTGGGRGEAVEQLLKTEQGTGKSARASRDPVELYRAIGAVVNERK